MPSKLSVNISVIFMTLSFGLQNETSSYVLLAKIGSYAKPTDQYLAKENGISQTGLVPPLLNFSARH